MILTIYPLCSERGYIKGNTLHEVEAIMQETHVYMQHENGPVPNYASVD